MRKKLLIGIIVFMGMAFFGYAYQNKFIQAAGFITGSNNHEAGNSLQLGEQVHMGGSALSDDLHTVLGVKDGYVYLLRKESANNGTASSYNNALNYADTTYKTQLGALGSTYISQSGNAVSLISKNELINLGIVSNDALVASIPNMTGNWWLKDANTSANRASYMTGTNSFLGENTIKQTTVSGDPNSDAGATCSISSTTETGILPINAVTQAQQLRHHYLSEAIFVYSMTQMTHTSKTYASTDCSGTATTSTGNAGTSTGKQVKFTKNSAGVETWEKVPGHGVNSFLMSINYNNFHPKAIGDTSSFTRVIGQCYQLANNSGNIHTISDNGSIKFTTNNTSTIKITNITNQKYQDEYCTGQTTDAGSGLIRPYIKMAVNDILMRNNSKRTYMTSSSLAESNIPASDNTGEYLTIQTNAINVGLRSGASGVSGNQYLTARPKNSTVVSLPLSFSGVVEGTRYVSAEATDTNGKTVYGVLKAVGSATSDSVDIDFANLLSQGTNSFLITLYLEDAGSKNTAYRSEGTTVTVQFENSDYPLVFTNPDVTNIRIGSADVQETITTDNPEIAVSGSDAVKYSLSGGISGTGLAVTNDPIDPKGFILSIGNAMNPSLPTDFTLTAELKTATSNQATASKQIHVFQGMSDFKWIAKRNGSYSTAEVGNNVLLGNLEVRNGLAKYTYALTSPSDSGYDATKAKDNSSFKVTDTALNTGEKAEVKTKTALLPGTYNIQFKVTDSYGDVLYTDATITVSANDQAFIYTDISGNELPKDGDSYKSYSEIYAPSKTFQLYTGGSPSGSIVTYRLKVGSPTDVISVDANSGQITILNASLNNQIGKVIVQATSHDPSGTYNDSTIELPITIEKCTRTISFADKPIYVINGTGSADPTILTDGVIDTSGTVTIEVDPSEDNSIAWTSNGKTINYNWDGAEGKDIKLHATKPGDRNYKISETDGMLHILGAEESALTLSTPGKIIYGDHFSIRSTQDDSYSTNVQYNFTVNDTAYISNPTVSGNKAEFDALKYSGNTEITITVKRTADGEVPLSKEVKVKILPKPIEITIDDKEKYKGETNPTLTVQNFNTQLVSWNGVQDIIQANDIKLNTTAKTDSNAGSYPIKGDSNTLNKTYPNYSFSFKEGILTIKEENIEDDWYHLEIDDGNNTAYTGNWTNQNVNIISDHNEYINLSLDQSTWNSAKVTVSKEGETNQSFWMKKDSGAITKEKQETIRIDKTAPKVKGIKAKDTNNKLQDIINKLSGGIFFKPGTAFEISTDDSNADLKVSGTKEISYKVYKVEPQARAGDELIKEGNLTVTNEKASITISETTGKYKVCVIPTDNAGNTNKESCHEVGLKKIDVDVDNDGKPDFNDPDGDGCPDLNIKWKDPNDASKWIIINGDRDYDGIPDLNIDSDGDGKPDLNIDTDHDGKPDLNLVILKKSDWKPSKCVKADFDNGILEEYCTGTNAKAVINVDTDGNNIPNINIDNEGDFKPHINISKDGMNPLINITVIHDWKPNKNYTSNKFTYDSIGKDDVKAEINIDSDNDGYPDINLDLDGDGVPDLNVDIDGDHIPDMNIDSSGDGKADINVDTDNDGKPDTNLKEITEWKPEHNVDGEFPYDTMEINEPNKPEEPNEPEEPKEPNIADEPNEPEEPKTSVKGYYNPATSMGGAKTGDQTNLLLYIGLLCSIMLGIVSYMAYKRKKNA